MTEPTFTVFIAQRNLSIQNFWDLPEEDQVKLENDYRELIAVKDTIETAAKSMQRFETR